MLQLIDGVMHYKGADGTWHPINSVHGAKGTKGLKGDTPSMQIGTVEQSEASAEIVDGKVNLSIPQGADGDVEIPQSLQPMLDDKADAVEGVTDLKAYIDNLIGGGAT